MERLQFNQIEHLHTNVVKLDIIQCIKNNTLSYHHFRITRIKYSEVGSQFIHSNDINMYIIWMDNDLILLYDKNMICLSMTTNQHNGS